MNNKTKTKQTIAVKKSHIEIIWIVFIVIFIATIYAFTLIGKPLENKSEASSSNNNEIASAIQDYANNNSNTGTTSQTQAINKVPAFANMMNSEVIEVMYVDEESTNNSFGAKTAQTTIIYHNKIDNHCYLGTYIRGKSSDAGFGGYDTTLLTEDDGITPMKYEDVQAKITELMGGIGYTAK